MMLQRVSVLALALSLSAMGQPALAQQDHGSSADQEAMSADSDNDGFLDYQELLDDSDPFDAESIPESAPQDVAQPRVGFPTTTCRSGFRQVANMCISIDTQNAEQFPNAMYYCRDKKARVATYGDIYYLAFKAPHLRSQYNPNGRWLGPDMQSDDRAFCGNRDVTTATDSDIHNFEGTCHKHDRRSYWCVHDRE